MPLDLVTVPCLSDNYAYLVHDAASGETALVDAPEAAPILAALEAILFQQLDDLARFIQGAHKRYHDFHIIDAHVQAHAFDRLALHGKTFTKFIGDIT